MNKSFNKIKIKNSFGDNYDPKSYMELADIDQKSKIRLFSKSWKNMCKNEDQYVELLPSVLTHETLHGVIDSIIEADILDVKDDHWPHLNGMDEQYANDYSSYD